MIREMLPEDSVLNTVYGPYSDTDSFTEVFLSQSIDPIYKDLAFTVGSVVGGERTWIYVSYFPVAPNIEIQINPWDGIPPDSAPQPWPTFWPTVPAPVPSVHP
jgi:hypothetical protein